MPPNSASASTNCLRLLMLEGMGFRVNRVEG